MYIFKCIFIIIVYLFFVFHINTSFPWEGVSYEYKRFFIMKPKVDFCFKELLSDEYVRRGFLSAILGVEPERILWTKLLPTYLKKQHKDDKFGVLDVRVMLQELGVSREETQTKVHDKFSASDEIVKEWLNKYWK